MPLLPIPLYIISGTSIRSDQNVELEDGRDENQYEQDRFEQYQYDLEQQYQYEQEQYQYEDDEDEPRYNHEGTAYVDDDDDDGRDNYPYDDSSYGNTYDGDPYYMLQEQEDFYNEREDEVRSEDLKEFDCPQCRAHHTVIMERLPTDYTILKEVAAYAFTVKREENMMCSLCTREKGREPVVFCPQCQSFVCQGCFEAHQYMTQFKDHTIVQLDKFEPQMVKPRAIFCTEHKNEQLSRYCGTCNHAICCECALNSHYDHKFLAANEAMQVVQCFLEGQRSEVKLKLKEFENNLTAVQKVEGHVIQYPDYLTGQVNASCDLAVKNIEAARIKLTSDIKGKYAEYAKKVWAEKDSVERTVTGLQSYLAFTERLLSSGDTIETLFLSTQARFRAEELKRISWSDATIQLPSLVFKDEIPVSVGSIVDFRGHENITINTENCEHIVAGSEFSIIISFHEYAEVLNTPSVVVSVTVFYGADLKFKLPDANIKIGGINLEQKCWPVTITCIQHGEHQLSATITVLGKLFATVLSGKFKVHHRLLKSSSIRRNQSGREHAVL